MGEPKPRPAEGSQVLPEKGPQGLPVSTEAEDEAPEMGTLWQGHQKAEGKCLIVPRILQDCRLWSLSKYKQKTTCWTGHP